MPAAYSSLATTLAPGSHSLRPFSGFSAQNPTEALGNLANRASTVMLEILIPLLSPAEALLVARTRLLVQICTKAPDLVWEVFEAA